MNPLSRRDAADGRFQANPTGGGHGAVGFVARRQRMYPYAILLASRPQPLGPPSTRNYGWNRARVFIDDARMFVAPPRPPNQVDAWPDMVEVASALAAGNPRPYVGFVEDVM